MIKKKAKDPEGIRSVLTVSSNGILPSLITTLKRVHLIPLPSLSTSADRDCFSRDGVHLTSKGEQHFHQDLVSGVTAVYSDLDMEADTTDRKIFQKDGNNKNEKPDIRNTDDQFFSPDDDNNKTINTRYNRKHTGGYRDYDDREGHRYQD